MNQQRSQSFLVTFVLVVAIAAMIYMAFQRESAITEPLTINEVAQAVQNGEVSKISIAEDNRLTIVYQKDGVEKTSQKEPTSTLVEQLVGLGVSPDKLLPANPGLGWAQFCCSCHPHIFARLFNNSLNLLLG